LLASKIAHRATYLFKSADRLWNSCHYFGKLPSSFGHKLG
jgi:hypothetical protein